MASKAVNTMQPDKLAVLIGLAISFPCAVSGAQWYSESSASLRSVYDDNIRLTSREHDTVVGMVLAGTMKAGRRTETNNINLKGGVKLNTYSGEDDLDTNDFDFGVDASHRTERDKFTASAAIKLDSTLTSELQSSGLMHSRKRRVKKNFALAWTRSLSERTSLKLGYSHIDTKYRNARNTGLSNYTYQIVDAMLTYSLNKKTVVSSVLTSSLYKGSNRVKTKTRDLGFTVGIKHNFSETFSAGAGVGVRYSDTEYKMARLNRDNNDTGFLLNANLKRSFERTTISGAFSRNVKPSGSGALLITDSLSAEVNYQVDERLSVHLASEIYRNASTDEDDESHDRVFFSIQPKVRWKMARWWRIEGSYRYRRQRYDSSGQSADSNAVFLTAKYIWPSKPAAGLW